jgi:hypothetical protein
MKYCILDEGNRRGFFFPSSKKKSRRGKIPKVSKLSGKRTVTGQNSGELCVKSTQGAIPNFWEGPDRVDLKRCFLIYWEESFRQKDRVRE